MTWTPDNIPVDAFPGQEAVRAKYPWPVETHEISGFGGGYEATCRNMLYAALKWMDEHPVEASAIRVKTYAHVFGLSEFFGDGAKGLEAEIMVACKNDCTGAMMHAVTNHFLFVLKNGWDAYCAEVRSKKP